MNINTAKRAAVYVAIIAFCLLSWAFIMSNAILPIVDRFTA